MEGKKLQYLQSNGRLPHTSTMIVWLIPFPDAVHGWYSTLTSRLLCLDDRTMLILPVTLVAGASFVPRLRGGARDYC